MKVVVGWCLCASRMGSVGGVVVVVNNNEQVF